MSFAVNAQPSARAISTIPPTCFLNGTDSSAKIIDAFIDYLKTAPKHLRNCIKDHSKAGLNIKITRDPRTNEAKLELDKGVTSDRIFYFDGKTFIPYTDGWKYLQQPGKIDAYSYDDNLRRLNSLESTTVEDIKAIYENYEHDEGEYGHPGSTEKSKLPPLDVFIKTRLAEIEQEKKALSQKVEAQRAALIVETVPFPKL